MKQKRLQGVVVSFTSFLLGLSLLLCTLSHVSQSWWKMKVKTSKDADHHASTLYFGLYNICITRTSTVNECFPYTRAGMNSFLSEMARKDVSSEMNINSNLQGGGKIQRNMRTLTSLILLFLTISFLLSLTSMAKIWSSNYLPIWIPYVQFTLTTFAEIIGVATLVYSTTQRSWIFESGVTRGLEDQGMTTSDQVRTGFGFVLLYMCVSFGLLIMTMHVLLASLTYFYPYLNIKPNTQHNNTVNDVIIEMVSLTSDITLKEDLIWI